MGSSLHLHLKTNKHYEGAFLSSVPISNITPFYKVPRLTPLVLIRVI